MGCENESISIAKRLKLKTIRKNNWVPVAGKYASYDGKYARLLSPGKIVRVVAEASFGRTVVEAIGRSGHAVKFTVLTSNLEEPQPLLFD